MKKQILGTTLLLSLFSSSLMAREATERDERLLNIRSENIAFEAILTKLKNHPSADSSLEEVTNNHPDGVHYERSLHQTVRIECTNPNTNEAYELSIEKNKKSGAPYLWEGDKITWNIFDGSSDRISFPSFISELEYRIELNDNDAIKRNDIFLGGFYEHNQVKTTSKNNIQFHKSDTRPALFGTRNIIKMSYLNDSQTSLLVEGELKPAMFDDRGTSYEQASCVINL